MRWDVKFTRQASKQTGEASDRVLLSLQLLIADLESKGPAPGKHWQHYGKLVGKKSEDKRHCHLVKGNPTYVCCWKVCKVEKRIEVYYVGTHEKAPY